MRCGLQIHYHQDGSDDPSAPEHEVVLQDEEGVISEVVEMRCSAAYKYK